MAKLRDRNTVVDQHFAVPPGLIDVTQETDQSGDFFDQSTGTNPSSIPITTVADVPALPATFTVVSQTVRLSPNGTSVIDVTFEFPDTTGIYSIDVRATKI